jgi:hypothetical protein
MADENKEYERARAWLLVKTENADAISDQLAAMYKDEKRGHEFGEGGDDLVVVRADVVDGEMNLVIPVDAASTDHLNRFKAVVQGMDSGAEIIVLDVRRHNPNPPHRSSTFVTAAELEIDSEPDFDPPGRHPQSPGRNAWG